MCPDHDISVERLSKAGAGWFLFVLDEPLVPTHSGGRAESLSELTALESAGLNLVILVSTDDNCGELEFSRTAHEQLLRSPIVDYKRISRLFAFILHPTMPNVSGRRIPSRSAVNLILRRIQDDEPPRAIVCAHDFMAPVAARFRSRWHDVPILVRSHNDEYRFLRATAKGTRNPIRRLFRFIDAERFRRAQGSFLRNARSVATISPDDCRAYVRSGISTVTIPPVLFGRSRKVDGLFAGEPREIKWDCIFVGALDVPTTSAGLEWFLSSVWPIVLDKQPLASLRIVGRKCPSSLLEGILGAPGVSFGGEVDDIYEDLLCSRVFVNPVLAGSGVNMKMGPPIECGLPIVTTSVGCRGLEPLRGSLMVGDSALDFASMCLRLLRDEDLRLLLGTNLSRLLSEHYSNTAVSAQLVDWILAEASDRSDQS